MQKFTKIKSRIVTSICSLLLFSASLSGQGTGCGAPCETPWGDNSDVTHFCTDGIEPYEAGTENKLPIPYFIPKDPLRGLGCLDEATSRYVPAWFIFKVGKVKNPKMLDAITPACVTGADPRFCADLSIRMEHSLKEDIDFVCWGPFEGDTKDEVLNKIYAGLPETLPPMKRESDGQRCSADQLAPHEQCVIRDAKEGEWYLLLITNYSMKPGLISFKEERGDAEISCPTPTGIGMDPQPVCEYEEEFSLRPVFAEGEEPEPGKMKYEWEAPAGVTLTATQKTAEKLTLKREDAPNKTLLDYAGKYWLTMTYESNPPKKYPRDVFIGRKYVDPTDTAIVKETNLPYKFEGKDFTATGVYTVALKTVEVQDEDGNEIGGCDSIRTLYLTVLKTVYGSDGETICASQLPWENPLSGTIFTAAGTENINLTASNGADSILTFTLKVITDKPSVTGLTSSQDGICEEEGKTIDLNATTSPSGATIKWFENGNPIPGSNDQKNITVTPLFTGTSGYSSENTYKVVVEFCNLKDEKQIKVAVDKPLTGKITGDSMLCKGGTTLNASSFEASTYSWTIEGSPVVLGTASTFSVPAVIATTEPIVTTYKVVMTRGKCTAERLFTVTVTTVPRILRIDSIGYLDRKIVVNENYGTPPFKFGVDGQLSDFPEKFNLHLGNHTFFVEDALNCKSKDSMHVIKARQPIFPSFFSPNGDGIHDTWEIENLSEYYPNAIVEIFDRSGRLVAKYRGADIGWDGTSNGESMPSTDYWYSVDEEGLDRVFVGHFTLRRR